jgi:farnesyl diphosphate synthase
MEKISNILKDFSTEFNIFFEKTIRDFTLVGDLQNALLYATTNGGKRIRPALCYIFSQMVNPKTSLNDILYGAASLEAIHCYSLVHDDLPSMDNDDLRRGLLTVHKKYTEATAILVGDALQTMAFDILSSDLLICSPQQKIKLIQVLSAASGAKGMVQGQFLDMNLDGAFYANNINHIKQMHQQKTGALITAACVMGVMLADIQNQKMVDNAYIIGSLIGELFQIQDDILDMTQSTQKLGKTAGKDFTDNKPTITALMGLDNAQKYADDLTQKLYILVQEMDCNTDTLKKFIDNLVIRQS